MSGWPNQNCWGFIIDTDSYAGNFEREMCAHITGRVGACGVGARFADDGVAEDFDMFVIDMPDEHGCERPCAAWTNDEHELNSVLIWFEDKPPRELIDIMKQRAETFCEKVRKVYAKADFMSKDMQPKILGYRVVRFKMELTEWEV